MPRTRKKAQPIRATPGGTYGDVKAQEDAQAAIPLPAQQQPQVLAPRPAPAPVDFGPFNRPTERPDEPVTAGLPIGPGAGPEAIAYGEDDALLEAQALYAATGSEEMRGVVEELQTRAGLL